MKNTLTHTHSIIKRQFLKKKEFEKCNMKSVNLEKALGCLRSKKVNDLKISQSIIYLKGFFYMFLSALKHII